MTEARSKRQVLPLIFLVKSFKKPLLIRNLKDYYIEVKLINATLLRVQWTIFKTSFYVEWKFRDIFREN